LDAVIKRKENLNPYYKLLKNKKIIKNYFLQKDLKAKELSNYTVQIKVSIV